MTTIIKISDSDRSSIYTFANKEEWDSFVESSKTGDYRLQPYSAPMDFPCVFIRESGIIPNSDGMDYFYGAFLEGTLEDDDDET